VNLEERKAALATANRRRKAAAELKDLLRTMRRWEAARILAEELERGFPEAPGAPVGPLLSAIPLIGASRVVQLLKPLDLTSNRRVCSLSDRQRGRLVARLRCLADEWEVYESPRSATNKHRRPV
jgi:hypothetical protein